MALTVFDFGWTVSAKLCGIHLDEFGTNQEASNVLPSPRHDAGSAQSGQDRTVRGLTSLRSSFPHSCTGEKTGTALHVFSHV